MALGQSTNLTGYVRDAVSGDVLVGANVYLVGTNRGDVSDGNGLYVITNIDPGIYVVKADYIGFKSSIDTLTFVTGLNIAHDIGLVYTVVRGEQVNVTAQAKGQIDAINRQLASKSIVNIVSSDRIQELPDANAAESVARIPGVTIQREGGEGNKVVIRGLSPKYNAISVDGIRLAATDSSDRSTDLSMISQYMLGGIEVTKAGTPDKDADVLGGTVNFKLKKAKPGFHINAITQGMYNDLKHDYNDYKLVLDVSNRFWGDRIGVLGVLDLENRNRSSQELGASYVIPNAQIDSNNVVRATGLNLHDIRRLNNRQNALFVVDFNIPNGNISYSNLSSSINKDETRYSESYSLGSNVRNFHSGEGENQIEVMTQSLRYNQTFFAKLHIEASASLTESNNSNKFRVFNFTENYAYDQSTQNVAISEIQGITKNDTGNTAFENYSFSTDISKETQEAYTIDLGYDFRLSNSISGKIKLGAKTRKQDREYDKDYEYGLITYVAVQDARDSLITHFPELDAYADPGQVRIPYWPFIDNDYESGEFLNGEYKIGPVADLEFMNEIFYFLRENFSYASYHEFILHRFHATNSKLYDYSGAEDYSAAYAMVDLDIGSKFNIITGARYEANHTTYDSWRGYQNVLPHFSFQGSEPYTHERNNEYLLPALFLRYRPFEWLDVRFAQTQTLTRPSYGDIVPRYHIVGGGNSIDFRNADLEPALSQNTDLIISVNQSHLGLFTVGYFEKRIDGLIYGGGRRYVANPAEYGLPADVSKYYIQDYISNNPHEVVLNGLELDYQTRFWYLPSFLSGLVFNANYTVTHSEVKYPRTEVKYDFVWEPKFEIIVTNVDTFYTDRLIDQPNEILNMAIGYDYKGFSGRLSMLFKSDVFRKTDFWPELRESTDDYTRWDLSLKQDLPIEGLILFLNVSNITESIDINRLSASNALSLEQHYGRTMDFGLRYSFQ
jgi:TonB-dependent receptor